MNESVLVYRMSADAETRANALARDAHEAAKRLGPHVEDDTFCTVLAGVRIALRVLEEVDGWKEAWTCEVVYRPGSKVCCPFPEYRKLRDTAPEWIVLGEWAGPFAREMWRACLELEMHSQLESGLVVPRWTRFCVAGMWLACAVLAGETGSWCRIPQQNVPDVEWASQVMHALSVNAGLLARERRY